MTTMRELVTLENPYGFEIVTGRLAFGPDDSKLAILSADGSLYIWDLVRLREGLSQMGLDWEAPARKPTLNREPTTPLPINVTVVQASATPVR